ncbi:hypothetical protein JDV02_002815 [Purpureocillium takamizusanense]|uniref:YMC020W-like alpha/beta hydrolase domain-containing protein n=1 Tax=Purpureocillium takamizusanense TaxID=2060973 RepID=A0A9Q8QCA8_9HYPO|nr:uncharacterized protein JDV02_002815 [Purpureocillium takamizusanense]UNI16379.1 hypothetical protein JDV02_002815 [Purpureocillium takamizusanense]
MMLPRKRQRPNPAAVSSASLPTTAVSPHIATSQAATSAASEPGLGQHREPHMPHPLPSDPSAASNPEVGHHNKELRKAKSWYGSWPRTPNKASASTSVARENILGGTVRSRGAPDLSRFDPKKGDDTASLRSAHASSLSKVPEDAPPESATSTNALADANDEPKQEVQSELKPAAADRQDGSRDPTDQQTTAVTAAPQKAAAAAASSGSWLGWWSRTPNTASDTEMTKSPAPPDDAADEARPSTPPVQTAADQPSADPPQSEPPPPSSSWFGFLGASSTTPSVKQDPASNTDATAKEPEDVVMEDAPPPPKPEAEPAPKAGSTWAFWSRDSPNKGGKQPDPESGEIAVMGEGSEAHPTPMAEGDVSSPPAKPSKADVKAREGRSTWRRGKRARPASMDTESPTPTPPNGSVADKAAAEPAVRPQTETKAVAKVDAAKAVTAEPESTPKTPPNLLLPSFTSTYQMKEDPSILSQIKSFLLRTSQPAANHVFRVKDPPKIRKAIAIGVHGLFPATYLRPMIGQPTGTSLRFASLCADAIRRWADAHGCGGEDCEIEKVALEGEGRISDRVDNLWKLLLNWIEHIRAADLILIASHSQGVPVSVMLLEKLIDLGIVTNARIGVCAMAGVALGPFPDYKSSILMGSAAELWDFGNPLSVNSQRFEAAMQRVLDYGARITFIGSIDDQLVPMESAVYSPASHPYIYRAVFIDGRVHAPDFIAHLVGFALKLRNLGVSDHGLVRELSAPLAGSLYSGEGHSRLYYDAAVYDLAVAHALETTSVAPGTPCEMRRPAAAAAAAAVSSSSSSSVKGGAGAPATAASGGAGSLGSNAATAPLLASPNPYVLPWIMRGVLEEDFVRTELHAETEELLRKFDDWRPANKALKDVKYRLEAVRSKL